MNPNRRPTKPSVTSSIAARNDRTKKNVARTPRDVERTSPRYDSPTASSSRKSPWAMSSTSRGLTVDTNAAFSRSLREDTPSSSQRSSKGESPQSQKQQYSNKLAAGVTSPPGAKPRSPRSAVPSGTRLSTGRANVGTAPIAHGATALRTPKKKKTPSQNGSSSRDALRDSVGGCDRRACICGPDCRCSEELCQCHAYQIIHSVSRPTLLLARGGGGEHVPTTAWRLECAVTGMTCSMCRQAVEVALRQALQPDSTITRLEVSLTTDTVSMEWTVARPENDPEIIRQYQQTVRSAIEGIGYTVESDIRIQRLPDEGARDPAPVEETSVEDRWQRYRQRQVDKVERRRGAFLWASAMTVPLIALTMIVPHFLPNLWEHKHIVLPYFHRSLALEGIILWALATPVQFLCGWEFYRLAWYSLRTGRAGMDLLVALGTTASYLYAGYGVWTADRHGAHFFETSAVLITLVLAGQWMQAAAVRRTSDAITQLMELQSPSAIRVKPQKLDESGVWNPLVDPYVEEIVYINEVAVGDVVKVIRGVSIPVDGIVLHGDIAVDESMMTGESSPVLKTKGSIVLGGTVCVESSIESDEESNHVGAAFIQVTGVGSSSALAKIVQLVQQAQTRAVPIQSFADQVSAIFVPTVCVISLVTYMVWYALCSTNIVPKHWYLDELGEDAFTFSLMFSIACLVISCPCALGLATPTAVMVGTGVGANHGVLMKGGSALEVASKVNTVVFDKTGTLTKGAPAVTDLVHLSDRNKDDASWEDHLLWLLGSLERTSEHPLAKAIVKFSEERLGNSLDLKPFSHPTDFQTMTGRGASGTIMENIHVAVGNRAFALSMGLEVTPQADVSMQNLEAAGKTAILVAVDGSVCLVLGIMDEVKPDAAASIAFLRNHMGMDVWMVTGDNVRTAAAISQQVGLSLSRVIAEALPADKLEKVRQLQTEGRIVGMVGDGINDSAALAQANVGMAMGTGADIATEASDMILVKGHVADVCTALHLSRALFRRIQWNLALSLVYNCLGIPIAAGVFYPLIHIRLPPTVAAVAMALSSVSVVFSSLTLRLYRPPNIWDRRPPSTTAWDRSMSRRNSHVDDDEDSMRQNLLSNDHLVSASELTQVMDNRSSNRAERLV